jgi:hypothetical protein
MVKMPITTQATIRACTQCLSESYVDPYITSVNHPDYLQLHLLLATAVKVCAGKERATIFLRYYERLRAYVEDVQQTTTPQIQCRFTSISVLNYTGISPYNKWL